MTTTPQQSLSALRDEYEKIRAKGLKLNMARGVPCSEQLALSEALFSLVPNQESAFAENGTDTRNYGLPDGLPELKRIFAPLLAAKPEELLIGGNSSLNLIYDVIADGMLRGFPESERPWRNEKCVKFLCPVPGYDRHFAILEALGIEMIEIPMLNDGPDLALIEKLCSEDASIKGIICVPKYQNPTGLVFSDDCIRRLARIQTKAPDFKFFWDNAYGVHGLYGYEKQLSLFDESKRVGTEDRVYTFMSTSKITFAGSGVSVLCSSEKQLAHCKKRLSYQTICYDKINQLRHARFFGDTEGLLAQMEKHAAILRPKFELVDRVLTEGFAGTDFASWHTPRGGYFFSLNVLQGTARRTHTLLKELGILMTAPGATYPHGADKADQNLRVAPTCPSLSELETAISALCLCAKIAALELSTN